MFFIDFNLSLHLQNLISSLLIYSALSCNSAKLLEVDTTGDVGQVRESTRGGEGEGENGK